MRELRPLTALVLVLLSRAAIGDDLDLPAPPPPPSPAGDAAPPGPSAPRPDEPAWIVPTPRPAPPVAPPPRKPRKRRILISDFRTGANLPADLGQALAAAAVREASQLDGYQVITRGDLVARLGTEHSRQMLGCAEDGTCLAELAGALDAEQSLGGTLVATGDGTLLTLTLVDMRQVTTIRTKSETLRGSPKVDDLADATRRMAYEVISGRPFDMTGTLDIEVTQEGTVVYLDEEEVGDGPYQDARRVTPGQHRVMVVKGEKILFSTDVRVEAAGRTTVRPRLDATALRSLPWGGPYYYGNFYVGNSNVRAFGQRGTCPADGKSFESGHEACSALAGLRLGVALTRWFALEGWAETFTAGWKTDDDGGYYARSGGALGGLAAVLRIPYPYLQAFGLRGSAGLGEASYESWLGSAAVTGAGTPSVKQSGLLAAGSVDLLLSWRWGPVRFEISGGLWGFGSAPPSKLFPAGVAAPYTFKQQPFTVGVGLIFPREPSREARRARSAPPPMEAPPYEIYRPPGT